MPPSSSAKGTTVGTSRRTLGALLTGISADSILAPLVRSWNLTFLIVPFQKLASVQSLLPSIECEAFILGTDPEDLHEAAAQLTPRFWLFGDGWDTAAWQYAVEIARDHGKEAVGVAFTPQELQAIEATDAIWLAVPESLLKKVRTAYKGRTHVKVIALRTFESARAAPGPTEWEWPVVAEVIILDQDTQELAVPRAQERKDSRHDH